MAAQRIASPPRARTHLHIDAPPLHRTHSSSQPVPFLRLCLLLRLRTVKERAHCKATRWPWAARNAPRPLRPSNTHSFVDCRARWRRGEDPKKSNATNGQADKARTRPGWGEAESRKFFPIFCLFQWVIFLNEQGLLCLVPVLHLSGPTLSLSDSMLRRALVATSVSLLRPGSHLAMSTSLAPVWPVLGAAAAARLDAELMATPGFSLDQLMELAGLSVACALAEVYPPSTHPRVLVVAGPGNNGGDGLVAARHLALFGYSPRVILPRRRAGDAGVANLLSQLEMLGIPVSPDMPAAEAILNVGGADSADIALDAIFGFSFSGPPREPLAGALRTLASVSEQQQQQQEQREGAGELGPGNCSVVSMTATSIVAPSCSETRGIPVVSVDVPSGWAVDGGDAAEDAATQRLLPSMLVSLTGEQWGIITHSFPA